MTTTETFFLLLRSGLYGTDIPARDLPEHIDWPEVLGMAKRQTVLGLVADAAVRLPVHLQPPAQTLTRLKLTTMQNLQAHAILNRAVAQCVTTLRQAGIPSVLLKGQGIAKCYIVPELRQCGDVDLYVGKDAYPQACKVAIESLSDSHNINLDTAKHLEFEYKKVPVELHRLALLVYTPWRKKRFYDWSSQQLESPDALEKTVISGTEVYLPPLDFNVVYIFYHLWHHFVTGGIGLRQLCDLAMLLHTRAPEVDHKRISSLLKRFSLRHQWQIIGYILVNYLGLPSDEMPDYSPKVKKSATNVLHYIMIGGNFGQHDQAYAKYRKEDGSKFENRMHTAGYVTRELVLKMRYDPIETLSIHGTRIAKGISKVFFEILKR